MKGLVISEHNPLVLTDVTVLGKRLLHGDLTTAEVERALRIGFHSKMVQQAVAMLKVSRELLSRDIDHDIFRVYTLNVDREVSEAEEPEPEEPAQTEQAAEANGSD